MAKASKGRSRAAARKLKDKWRSKQWYSVVAPPIFEAREVGQTLTDDPQKLMGRNLEFSYQTLTGNYRQSHIKLNCKITGVSGLNANTSFSGHHLTMEYTKRLVQRRKSKMIGIMDVITKDGSKVRVKILLTTNRRTNSSKQSLILKATKEFTHRYARNRTFTQLVNDMLSNSLSIQVFKHVKPIYPVKRVEVYKSEVLRSLTPGLAVEEEKDFDAVEDETLPQKAAPEGEPSPKEAVPEKESDSKEAVSEKESGPKEVVPKEEPSPKEEPENKEEAAGTPDQETKEEEPPASPKEEKTEAGSQESSVQGNGEKQKE